MSLIGPEGAACTYYGAHNASRSWALWVCCKFTFVTPACFVGRSTATLHTSANSRAGCKGVWCKASFGTRLSRAHSGSCISCYIVHGFVQSRMGQSHAHCIPGPLTLPAVQQTPPSPEHGRSKTRQCPERVSSSCTPPGHACALRATTAPRAAADQRRGLRLMPWPAPRPRARTGPPAPACCAWRRPGATCAARPCSCG